MARIIKMNKKLWRESHKNQRLKEFMKAEEKEAIKNKAVIRE